MTDKSDERAALAELIAVDGNDDELRNSLSAPPSVAALIEELRANPDEFGTMGILRGEAADALARLQKERDEARFAPMGDNHHNAAACPYCRPALARLSAPVPDTDAAQDDLREILRAVGLSDSARPYSPHEVVHRELLPHLRALRNVIEKYDGNSNNPYWAEEFNQAMRIARAHLDAPHATATPVPEQNNVPAVEDPHDQIAQLRKRLAAERQGVRYRHTPKDMVPDRCGNWVAFDPSRLESAAAPVPAREWIPVGERAELSPCPFCRGKAEHIVASHPKHARYVMCLECNSSTAMTDTAEQATELWNRRSYLTGLRDWNEGLPK